MGIIGAYAAIIIFMHECAHDELAKHVPCSQVTMLKHL